MTLDSRGFPWGFHIHSRGPVGGALERSPSKQPCPIEQDVDRPSPRYESRPWSALASRLEGRVAAQVAQNLLHFDQITSQPIEPSARLEPCEEAESYDTGVGELNQKKKKKGQFLHILYMHPVSDWNLPPIQRGLMILLDHLPGLIPRRWCQFSPGKRLQLCIHDVTQHTLDGSSPGLSIRSSPSGPRSTADHGSTVRSGCSRLGGRNENTGSPVPSIASPSFSIAQVNPVGSYEEVINTADRSK